MNPWLDPSEVRHLAEQLIRPVAQAKISAPDPGFDSSFIGFVKPSNQVNPNLPKAPPQRGPNYEVQTPENKRERTVSTEEQPQTSPETVPVENLSEPINTEKLAKSEPQDIPKPVSPPNPPSQTRFLERIKIFRDWLAKNFEASDIFILDREGKVIFDESGHGRLHFMARNLAIASRGSSNIHVKIGPAAILEVVPCETPYGRIVLGTLVPEALPPEHVNTILGILKQTASPS
ncbi:MAG: hypothetical protein AB8D78_11500 [Akkermansiaceae bacterium]